MFSINVNIEIESGFLDELHKQIAERHSLELLKSRLSETEESKEFLRVTTEGINFEIEEIDREIRDFIISQLEFDIDRAETTAEERLNQALS